MKATGIIRRVDELGRFVIPKEIRRSMGIQDNDGLEIYTTNDGCLVLQKYVEGNDQMPDIFQSGNSCGNPAQPTAKTENRKQVVIHDREDNEHYYLSLTEQQIKLLDWLDNEYIWDNDRYEWEVLGEIKFVEP